jgi:DNA-binding NarL/FixJ family response regulator/class 3 adenylate cyclase
VYPDASLWLVSVPSVTYHVPRFQKVNTAELPLANEHRARVERFRQKHRTALLTLLFSDIVGAARLKQDLGDSKAIAIIQQHHSIVRKLLGEFKEAQEIGTAGDSFFIVLLKPSDAVKFALLLQSQLRDFSQTIGQSIQDRIGIHVGEVFVERRSNSTKPTDFYGLQVDTCARVMSLAFGDQILTTRAAFDSAQPILKGSDIPGLGEISWVNHGPYSLKGVDAALDVCEVGEKNKAALKRPIASDKGNALPPVRLIIADNHPIVRSGLRAALEKLGSEVIGEANDGREAIQQAESLNPDVVLMDITMPVMNGLEATRQITSTFPSVKVIILSRHDNPEYYWGALKAGACGYVLKRSALPELQTAIERVRAGEIYLSRDISQVLLRRFPATQLELIKNPVEQLTARQREILQLIAEGQTTKQIALILKISPKTVEYHRAKLMEQLNIFDIPGLVRFALRSKLLDQSESDNEEET